MKYYAPENFDCKWLTDINDITENQWISVFGLKCIKSIAFFKSIQQSDIPNVTFFYFTASRKSELLAIVPCFSFKLDLLDLIGKSQVKNMLLAIREIFPKFLKIKTFVIGSYATSCEYFVGVRETNKYTQSKLFTLIKKNIKMKAKELKIMLTIIKEIRESQIEEAKHNLLDDFCFCKSYPNTFVPTFSECRPYPVALKRNNKRRYKRMKEKFAKIYTWEVITDFSPYRAEFEKLYFNVLKKAKNKFEILNGDFFFNIKKNLPSNTFFIAFRDKKNNIRSMALVVEEEDRLIPLYLGMDYQDDDARVLYINMLFKIIELSEHKDKSLVEFGQTSYYPKIMSGAFIELIYYGFSSYNIFVFKILQKLVSLNLFDIKLFPHVYKTEKLDLIISKSKNECGFKIYN